MVYNKVRVSKRQDIKKTMEEKKFEMRVHKLQNFGPQSHTTPKTLEITSGRPLTLVTVVPQGTSTTSRSISTPLTIEMIDSTSMPLVYLEYKFI